MSSAAPASPAAVRTSTSSRHGDRPHRAQSTASRSSAAATATPHRSLSQSHSHTRSTSGSQQGTLTNVARRDFEQTNVAQPPSSHRTVSRDRTSGSGGPARSDSTRSSHNPSSRQTHARYASDASTVVPPNGTSIGGGSRAPAATTTSRGRRTTIEAPTGVWSLGKTIGAGSMGKVKLAKNMETGEQVCRSSSLLMVGANLLSGCSEDRA